MIIAYHCTPLNLYMVLSENRVPLNPLVNHRFPVIFPIKWYYHRRAEDGSYEHSTCHLMRDFLEVIERGLTLARSMAYIYNYIIDDNLY